MWQLAPESNTNTIKFQSTVVYFRLLHRLRVRFSGICDVDFVNIRNLPVEGWILLPCLLDLVASICMVAKSTKCFYLGRSADSPKRFEHDARELNDLSS